MAEERAKQWPTGWYDPSERECASLEHQLQIELGQEHKLKGRPARLIARRRGSDDALFELDGGAVALVHLTWRQSPEPKSIFPACEIFRSFEEWRSFWVSNVEPTLN